jgi:hypothetical protein
MECRKTTKTQTTEYIILSAIQNVHNCSNFNPMKVLAFSFLCNMHNMSNMYFFFPDDTVSIPIKSVLTRMMMTTLFQVNLFTKHSYNL